MTQTRLLHLTLGGGCNSKSLSFLCVCLAGSGVRTAEQCGECLQPGSHHLQGSSGSLRLHQRPPPTDPAGHDRPREERGGGGQVRTLRQDLRRPNLWLVILAAWFWLAHKGVNAIYNKLHIQKINYQVHFPKFKWQPMGLYNIYVEFNALSNWPTKSRKNSRRNTKAHTHTHKHKAT